MDFQNKNLKIWWDDKDSLVRVRAFGILDEETAKLVLDATIKIAEKFGNQIDWLIDLSQMTKPSSKARKILAEATGHPSIRKYAFVGASIFLRTVANFIAAAAGQKNARHFSTEEEAMRWVKDN
jgi:hypothetical protein